jgi:transposase
MSQRESGQSPTVEELARENQSLRKQLDKAQAEIERLRKELEEALRRLKRQAAPFSRRQAKKNPKRPGRKGGGGYGKPARRPVPERVDEEIPVPLPLQCECGGEPVYEETRPQYQEDIVRQTVVRRFDVEIGHCARCRRRVQGRHPLQTSDALGAAQVQVGPEALSLAAHLNKQMGISHERVARVLELSHGLEVSRSGLCRALLRLADKAEPTYQQLRVSVEQSDIIWIDETGWRVAARLDWLWVVRSPEVTVYDILAGRGFQQAASLLGPEYEGWLIHDGWAPYYRFGKAFHQSCLAHLMRRCEELIEKVSPAAAQFPSQVLKGLKKALALRDRYLEGALSERGLAIATGRLEAELDRWLEKTWRLPANQRLANHLRHEQPWLFTFLHCPGIDPTNNAAERALRPAVIARKTWGGNRTKAGARAQKILMSVFETCRQQGKDCFQRLTALLRSPVALAIDLVPSGRSP